MGWVQGGSLRAYWDYRRGTEVVKALRGPGRGRAGGWMEAFRVDCGAGSRRRGSKCGTGGRSFLGRHSGLPGYGRRPCVAAGTGVFGGAWTPRCRLDGALSRRPRRPPGGPLFEDEQRRVSLPLSCSYPAARDGRPRCAARSRAPPRRRHGGKPVTGNPQSLRTRRSHRGIRPRRARIVRYSRITNCARKCTRPLGGSHLND